MTGATATGATGVTATVATATDTGGPAVPRTARQRRIDHLVAAVYAAACFGAVLAPALAVRWAVFRSDIGGVAGRDLVAASVCVGAGQAAVAWARLRCEERTAARRSHIWIASLNALVVLALSSSLLVLAVLRLFADEHAAIVDRGLPVVALWAGLQLVAVALAELAGRAVFWWLEPHPAPHRACRWGVLPPARGLARRARALWRAPMPAPARVSARAAALDAPRQATARRPADDGAPG